MRSANCGSVVRLGAGDRPVRSDRGGGRARGPALVLVPSLARVERLQRRLRDERIGGVVVGARAGAWAACDGLAAVVVIDAHDEVYTEERAPTWNAWRVAAERAARAGVPCVLVTPTPSLEHLAWGELVTTDVATERRGWARVEVIDRRGDDPRTGLWSTRVVDAVRAPSVSSACSTEPAAPSFSLVRAAPQSPVAKRARRP